MPEVVFVDPFSRVVAALKKEEGNKLYSAQNYTKAVELYTESIGKFFLR